MEEMKEMKENKNIKVNPFKEDLVAQKQALKNHERNLKWQEKEYAIKKELMDIQAEGIKLIKPEREYDKNPRFWELQAEFNTVVKERELYQIEEGIKQTKSAIAELKIDIEKGE